MSIRKLAGETVIYGVSSILTRVLNFLILTPFLTYNFLRADYAIINELFTYAGLLTILFTYRMETTFFRFGSKEDTVERAYSTAVISLLISTFVFAFVLLSLSAALANWLGYPGNTEFIQLIVIIVSFDALMAIPFARLRLENRPIRFATLKILHVVINLVLIFFFLKFCPIWIEQGATFLESIYDPTNRIQYVFFANLLASGFIFLLLLPSYWKVQWSFDFRYWKDMFWYALPLVVVGIAGVINNLGAIPLLTHLGIESVEGNRDSTGVYSATIKLAVFMNLFTQAFNYAAEPFFFRHSKEKGSREMYGQVGLLFTIVGSIAFLGIMLYIEVIQLFLGPDFRSGVEIVPILLIANLLLGIYYNFSIWFKLADKTIWGAYISTGGALITILTNVALIAKYGYLASAWATFACYAFMVIVCYLSGRRFYPIPYPIGRMLTMIAIAIGFYMISNVGRTWIGDNLIVLLGINTLLLLAYLGIVYLLEGKAIRDGHSCLAARQVHLSVDGGRYKYRLTSHLNLY